MLALGSQRDYYRAHPLSAPVGETVRRGGVVTAS